ncbi:MAG: winged helix-turn-helix domain-containing protein [Rhodococcus sp. (in: high G+C Gram-positive bacteria)]
MARVLLIEDDPSVARAIILGLSRLAHVVVHRSNGDDSDLLQLVGRHEVVLLDIGLPGMDGFEVCRRIRTTSGIPIVVLTARSDDIDVVAGLEAGADDYVSKPVSPRVLDARIKAVVRRAASVSSTDNPEVMMFGDLTIDRAALTVLRGGHPIVLSPTERRLILTLADNAGRVLSRQQLLETVWEHTFLGDSRVVDTAVQRLRIKIEPVPTRPTVIETVRGFGYRLIQP